MDKWEGLQNFRAITVRFETAMKSPGMRPLKVGRPFSDFLIGGLVKEVPV
jgi:hypothetical protein